MAKYTLESLKEINLSYHAEHRLTQWDVDMVNQLIEVIEGSRKQDIPQVGDIVEFTNEYGDYYKNAHIETNRDGELYICERPSLPFTTAKHDKTGISTSTSGGAWSHIPSNLTYVGTREKAFVAWGHCGACGNGAVTFFANVSVWEYIEGNPDYTTKTHDKFHVHIREKVASNEYKYLITRGGSNHTAFRKDEEYQAWLKTFHGIEKEGAWGNNKIVWTYKQDEKCLPLEEYLKIDGVIDSTLCNGSIQECKRVYEGTSVRTFIPHQNDRIELKGVKEYMRAY